MKALHQLSSSVVPLLEDDIDTDQIIPARYLKVTDREGLAKGLFANWRTRPDGQPDPDFVLEQERYQGARILLSGNNFGCGSSREHAPWALLQHGFRAVIAASFADIFRANALGNGLLVVALDLPRIERLAAVAETEPTSQVTLDVTTCTANLPWGESVPFELDPFARHCLLEGLDPLGYLLRHESAIDTYITQGRPSPLNTLRLVSSQEIT